MFAKKEETIVALATPPGEGGIAIIRLSGKEAFALIEKLVSKSFTNRPTHTATLCQFLDLDQVIVLIMRSPKSYTGEDVVEIHCHGGFLLSKKILEAVIQQGARAAEPGEFTLRAFLNGKIDLSQAEAVQSLIQAQSESAVKHSQLQLRGLLSAQIQSFQKQLVNLAAILEAWVDFPEEGLEFASLEEMIHLLTEVQHPLEQLAQSFDEGKKIEHGIKLCLLGLPNAGKSSLMNGLLRKDRAIVTPIAGTTRDILEEPMKIGSFHFQLSDTAGLRETEEEIEKEGIRRSWQAAHDADLILWVADATKSLSTIEKKLIDDLPFNKTLVIWNKVDLPLAADLPVFEKQIFLSAKDIKGLESLKSKILEILEHNKGSSQSEVVITHLRHYEALSAAINHLKAVKQGLITQISPEFISFDMKAALSELSKIIGSNVTEEILNAIFSKFCVGK